MTNGQKKSKYTWPAASSVAEIAMFIESKGLPQTAKKFVDEAFAFFGKLFDDRIIHKPCTYSTFKWLDYRCITYKKKYVVVYLSLADEIVICDFVSAKLLK